MREKTKRVRNDNVPQLYETEDVPAEKKTIYQKWEIQEIGFYWLIAELDRKENVAYGYANLNDDQFAEWGYISIDELIENNASFCPDWTPCTFEDAQKRINNARESHG